MKNKFILSYFLISFSLIVNSQQRTVGILENDSLALNGYTLISNLNSESVYLIDNCGEIVNSWLNSSYKPGPVMYLLEDGSLLRTGKVDTGNFIVGGSGGIIERFDWNDSLIWSYKFDGANFRSHHDIYPMSNNNILVLSWDRKTLSECLQAGLNPNHYNGEIWFEKVTEIQQIGDDSAKVVWEWRLWNHLIQEYDNTKLNFGDISATPYKVDINYSDNNGISPDYFHANGIDYNPKLDQIIISVRNYDEFWIIDHSTTTLEAASNSGGKSGMGGQILYRWGNQATYETGSVLDKKLFGQHHPNWIKTGVDSGKIMVFNNGYNAPVQESKVQIVNPPLLANGTYQIGAQSSFLPDSAEWSYTMPLFVDFVSGAYRLPNENTFITSGPDGHLYEIDNKDSVVWEYVNPLASNNQRLSQGVTPSGNAIFRAYKYPHNYSAFTNRALTPTVPIELNPTSSNCVIYPHGRTVNVENNTEKEQKLRLFPNPVNESLTLELNERFEGEVRIFDLKGKLCYRNSLDGLRPSMNLSFLSRGVYTGHLVSPSQNLRFKFIKN